MDDEGITVPEALRFYPFRATFDFECFFDRDNVPADSDKLQWIARHVPLSVSLASNVPGYEPAQCYVTDGDSDKLVADMMSHLHAVSDAAYESLLSLYADVLDKLKMLKEAWDDAESEANAEEEEESSKTNPFNTLAGQLHDWLHQLPVIGFHSGKYDLNMIKRSFVPLLISNNAAVIKRQNTYMCLYTDKLKFVDICNYLAPGVSYAKYLTAYGCELGKGHFPYEYMDDLQKLEDRVLPPQSAFFSQLKNEGISDADYARCQAVWHDNQMKTMRDFLVWYNNRDVIPFLQAIDKQFAFYQQHNIDMFKDGYERSRPLAAPPLQRPTQRHLLHRLQSDEQRSAPTSERQHRLWSGHHLPSLPRKGCDEDSGWIGTVPQDRRLRRQRAISVGHHAGHAHGVVYAASGGK